MAAREGWMFRRRGGTPSRTVAAIRRAKTARRLEESAQQPARGVSHQPVTTKEHGTMINVESQEVAGISQAMVERYGAIKSLITSRSDPKYGLIYDRSAAHDGSDLCGPLSASRHTADHWKRPGWVAIRLVEEHATPDGGKWREVDALPDDLRIAGE